MRNIMSSWKLVQKINKSINNQPTHPLEGLTILEIEEILTVLQMDYPDYKDFKYVLKFKAEKGNIKWWYELLGKK